MFPPHPESLEVVLPVDKVLTWREDRLLKMGFELTSAMLLAADRFLDLHKVERALARGCSHERAVEIFA